MSLYIFTNDLLYLYSKLFKNIELYHLYTIVNTPPPAVVYFNIAIEP